MVKIDDGSKGCGFLNNERVAVLATMLADGTPHTSAMHFIYHDGALYFSTQPTSRKAKDLSGITKASVTVGFSEKDWITIQLDGTLEKQNLQKNYM